MESVAPEAAVVRLMAGNKRFVENDFTPLSRIAKRRERLNESQAPFAAILSCSDSRVVPELAFMQGLGELFVVRVAGNHPDELVIGSLEFAIEQLGTRLVMVLGHQNCGAVTAVYSAIETATPLPPHLDSIERLIAPGIQNVVRAHGSLKDAVIANVNAAVNSLKIAPPVLSKAAASGRVRIVGAYKDLGDGRVTLVDEAG